jgi:hypothetical protein
MICFCDTIFPVFVVLVSVLSTVSTIVGILLIVARARRRFAVATSSAAVAAVSARGRRDMNDVDENEDDDDDDEENDDDVTSPSRSIASSASSSSSAYVTSRGSHRLRSPPPEDSERLLTAASRRERRHRRGSTSIEGGSFDCGDRLVDDEDDSNGQGSDDKGLTAARRVSSVVLGSSFVTCSSGKLKVKERHSWTSDPHCEIDNECELCCRKLLSSCGDHKNNSLIRCYIVFASNAGIISRKFNPPSFLPQLIHISTMAIH